MILRSMFWKFLPVTEPFPGKIFEQCTIDPASSEVGFFVGLQLRDRDLLCGKRVLLSHFVKKCTNLVVIILEMDKMIPVIP